MDTIVISISGMTCGGCEKAVTRILLALPGVVKADVSHVKAKAEVSYNHAQVKPEQLKSAIEDAGYVVVG